MSTKARGGPPSRIKFEGVYDWDNLYKLFHSWFEERGWDHDDKTYKHKTSSLGREEELIINCWVKESEYIKYHISLDIHTWSNQPAEVIKDGKKVQLWKGRIRIIICNEIEYDWQNRFEGSSFLTKIREFYHKHVFVDEDNALIQDKVYYISYNLHEAIKKFLDMYSQENVYSKSSF